MDSLSASVAALEPALVVVSAAASVVALAADLAFESATELVLLYTSRTLVLCCRPALRS